jgi:hypothetical protein
MLKNKLHSLSRMLNVLKKMLYKITVGCKGAHMEWQRSLVGELPPRIQSEGAV